MELEILVRIHRGGGTSGGNEGGKTGYAAIGKRGGKLKT